MRIFQNFNNNWIKSGDSLLGEAPNDHSGESVSINSNGTIVAIGAYANDGNGQSAGHVRIFKE